MSEHAPARGHESGGQLEGRLEPGVLHQGPGSIGLRKQGRSFGSTCKYFWEEAES